MRLMPFFCSNILWATVLGKFIPIHLYQTCVDAFARGAVVFFITLNLLRAMECLR